jgi:hypothetical protein
MTVEDDLGGMHPRQCGRQGTGQVPGQARHRGTSPPGPPGRERDRSDKLFYLHSLRVFSESPAILRLFGARRLSQQDYPSFPEP